MLHDLDPELQPPKRGLSHQPNLARLEGQLAKLAPVAQVRIGRSLIARLRELNPQIDALARELAPLVRRRHALLLEVPAAA